MKNEADENQENQIESTTPDDSLVEDIIAEFADCSDDFQPKDLTKEQFLEIDQYAPRIIWNMNRGMDCHKMHKLFCLFVDEKSKFHLKNLTTLNACENDFIDEEIISYSFQSDINDNQAFLYKPDFRGATYATCSQNKASEKLNEDFIFTLESVKGRCNEAQVPTRFIIPFSEGPDIMDKGTPHSVLLVIDYFPDTQQLKSVVFDSIGRNTMTEQFSRLWCQKDQSTADYILNKEIQNIFTGENLQADDLYRIGYNHQNRALEGNCNSYTFVCIHQTLQSFIDGKSIDEFISSIPEAGYIYSNSFLDDASIEEITNCVNFRSLSNDYIDTLMLNIGNDEIQYELMNENRPLEEFEEALRMYKSIRTKEAEKSSLNFFGYGKNSKIQATVCLITALDCLQTGTPMTTQIQTELVLYQPEICNGRLASLVNYHLQQIGLDSIDSLITLSAKPEYEFDDNGDSVLNSNDNHNPEKEKHDDETLSPKSISEYKDRQRNFKREMISIRVSQNESEAFIQYTVSI